MTKTVLHNSVTLFVVHNVIFIMSLMSLIMFENCGFFQAIMNNINDIMNNINGIMNDKGPFPLHEQRWYRTGLLETLTTLNTCHCGSLSL